MNIIYIQNAVFMLVALGLIVWKILLRKDNGVSKVPALRLVISTGGWVLLGMLWYILYTAKSFHEISFKILTILLFFSYAILPYCWSNLIHSFLIYVKHKFCKILVTALVCLNLAVLLMSVFIRDFIWYFPDAEYRFVPGRYFMFFGVINLICYIVPLVEIIFLFITGLRNSKYRIALLLFALIPPIGIYIDDFMFPDIEGTQYQMLCFLIGTLIAYFLLIDEQFKENLHLTSSMSDEFESVMYVDFTSNILEVYRYGTLFCNSIAVWQNYMTYEERMRMIADILIPPEYSAEFKAMVDPKNIADILKDQRSCFYNFRIKTERYSCWYQVKIVRYTEAKSKNAFMIGFRDVTDEIRRELVYKNAIYAEASAYYEINLTENRIVGGIHEKVNGEFEDTTEKRGFTNPMPYSYLLEYWLYNYVEDSDLLDFIPTRENLLEKFTRGEYITTVYYRSKAHREMLRDMKMVFIMSHDAHSENIMCLAVAEEVTPVAKQALEISKYNEMVSILTKEYSSVYYVNFLNDTVQKIDERSNSCLTLGLKDRYQAVFSERMERFILDCVQPKAQANMNKASKADYVCEQLRTGNAFSTQFELLHNEERIVAELRYRGIVVNDKIAGAVMGFIDVNQLRGLEKEQAMVQMRNDEMIKMLASEYNCIYYYDPASNQVIPYATENSSDVLFGEAFKGARYNDAIDTYIKMKVADEDQDEMRSVLDLANIYANLQKEEYFTKVYLNRENQYCEVKCAQSPDNRAVFVLGFANKDEIIRASRRQNKFLRDSVSLIQNQRNPDKNITNLLQMMVQFFNADRAYVYEINHSYTLVDCTYEWCKEGIKEQIKLHKNLEVSLFSTVIKKLENGDQYLEITSELSGTPAYRMLSKAYVNSSLSTAFFEDGIVRGFIGVDNPRIALDDTLVLRASSTLIYSEILKRKQTDVENTILTRIASTYRAVGYVELLNDVLKTYQVDDSYSQNMVDGQYYSTVIDAYVRNNVAPVDKERMRRMLDAAYVREELRTHKEYSVSFLEVVDGTPRHCEYKFIRTNEMGTCAVIGIRDNSTAVEHEQEVNLLLEEARDRALEEKRANMDFLAQISHDIRTPIDGLVGITTLARRHIDEKEKVLSYLDKIDEESKHLGRFAENILDMSKEEGGQTEIVKRSMNLKEFMEKCIGSTKAQLEGRDISFESRFEDVTHAFVLGDEIHLRQAVNTILSNAVKFTNDGGSIVFGIREMTSDEETASFRIEVADTGVGMKPEYLKCIWEPDQKNEAEAVGTGLGLPMTKQLVELMGGEIAVESTPNEGSVFTIDIRFRIDEDGREMDPAGSAPIFGKHILLVEDNDMSLDIVRELLEEDGAIVTAAQNGREAVDIYMESPAFTYDAILMDIVMPVMDGLLATETIRKADKEDAMMIPIIAMTANAFDEDVRKSKEAGMNTHLSKPVRSSVLIDTLSRFLSR